MPSPSHDILTQTLRDDPSLLRDLLFKVTGADLPGPLSRDDSTIRFSPSPEMRPDLVVRMGDTWIAGEVQNRCDPDKARKWLLAVAALHDSSRRMGELVVFTASPSVARWAHQIAHVTGPLRTTLRLSPLVILLDEKLAASLLDPTRPELALCAAWAMKHRHGPAARKIVDRALDMTTHLPEPLQTTQFRAIFNVLSKQLRARLEQTMINPEHIYESPAHRRLRRLLEQHGRAEGAADAAAKSLLVVLEARALPVTKAQRARIEQCTDVGQLQTWTRRAVTAASTADVLSAPAEATPKPRQKRRNGPPPQTR